VTHVHTILDVYIRFSFIRFCTVHRKDLHNSEPVLDAVQNIRRNFLRLARIEIRLSGQPGRN